jgi:hypothetical protein
MDSCTRRNSFQITETFEGNCQQLPSDNQPFGHDLDLIREDLIDQYLDVGKTLPELVNPDSSDNNIYELFNRHFNRMKEKSHGLELVFLEELLKGREREAPSVWIDK